MATLFDLAQQYLNRALPETFRYDRTPPIGTNPPGLFPQPPVKKPIEKILPRPGGNEEGFSVYNPDPNRTRTEDQYSPYAYNRAMRDTDKFGQTVGPNPDLYYQPPLKGIPGAIQGYMKNSIPGQLIGSAVRGIESLLPVNPRAKLENELLGSGIMLDDIGRVVSNDYNTAEGIMAGYNAAKVTDKTFDKRRDTIEKTLGTKYGLSKSQIEAAKKDPNYTGPGANLVNRLGLLDESQDLFDDARTRTKDILKEEYKKDPKYQFTGPNVQGDFKSILDTKPKAPPSKPKGPPTGINRPGTPSKPKGPKPGSSNPRKPGPGDRGRGQSNVGTKSKGPVSTKGQAGPPSQRGGGGGGGGGGGCFLKGTLITMLDGTRKPVEQVDLGNEVAIGGKVFATGKFLVKNLHDYKGIKVSGSHMVSENNKWVRVEDSEHGKLLGNEEHTVYVFGSENRRILINDILFTDYFEVNEQDKLMNNEEDFFDNWKLYAKQDSGNNVDIINAS